MGMISRPYLKRGSELMALLMDLYETMGDRISIQYGGSQAHKKGKAYCEKIDDEISLPKSSSRLHGDTTITLSQTEPSKTPSTCSSGCTSPASTMRTFKVYGQHG